MIRLFALTLIAAISGCLSTSPPKTNGTSFAGGAEFYPETPAEIEGLLESQRDSHLRDLLAESSDYSGVVSPPLALGMPRKYVQLSMGSPTQIEIAGNPEYGNERWTYELEIPTPNGFINERRYIYFENHQVVGWEID